MPDQVYLAGEDGGTKIVDYFANKQNFSGNMRAMI